MNKDIDITKVSFRKFKDGQIIALFPEIDYFNYYNGECLSYMHVGQHSAANYQHCVKDTQLCTEEEYKPLFEELTSLGYNLSVIKRYTRK